MELVVKLSLKMGLCASVVISVKIKIIYGINIQAFILDIVTSVNK